MKNTLILLALLVGLPLLAAPTPKQRTRTVNFAGGTNQWLATMMVTNVTYTNSYINLWVAGSAGFFRVGDDVTITGLGTTGTNGVDRKDRVVAVNGAVVRTMSLMTLQTNIGTNVVGFITLDEQFTSLTFLGKNGPRINNTDNVFIGLSTNEQSQPFLLSSGSELVLQAAPQGWLALTNWALSSVTDGDGTVILYFPR